MAGGVAMTMSTIEALMAQMGGGAAGAAAVCSGATARGDRVTVVGSGSLAIATLFALLAQRISKDIVIIDKDLRGIRKELADAEDAALYMGCPNITATTEWDRCRDSRVVILAMGDAVELELDRSVRLVRSAVLSIVSACPGAVLVVATRPSDVLAWCAWRIASPNLPTHRVLGVGCTLETARLRRAVARRLHIAPAAVQATVLGRSTPVWTTLTACGVRLRDINPKLGTLHDPEDWLGSLDDLVNVPGVQAIAAAAAYIADAIIRDSRDCIPVATHVSGCRNPPNPNKDVFMSLPCVMGHTGVAFIVRQSLSAEEKAELQEAADNLSDLQSSLEIN